MDKVWRRRPACGFWRRPAAYLLTVAQISNLPYRRFLIGRTFLARGKWQLKNLRKTTSLRYGRGQHAKHMPPRCGVPACVQRVEQGPFTMFRSRSLAQILLRARSAPTLPPAGTSEFGVCAIIGEDFRAPRRFFGARVCDPQHSGKSTSLEQFNGFPGERLLRVTDPRSALVAALPCQEISRFAAISSCVVRPKRRRQ